MNTFILPRKYQWCKWDGRLPEKLAEKIELSYEFKGVRPVVEILRTKPCILFRITHFDSFGSFTQVLVHEMYETFWSATKPLKGAKRCRINEHLQEFWMNNAELNKLAEQSNALLKENYPMLVNRKGA